MDEHERRRLLRALTGQEPEPEPDPAVAISDAVRAAWHEAVRETAGMIERRIRATLEAWGQDVPEDPTTFAEQYQLLSFTVEDAVRARVAHVYVFGERPAFSKEARGVRFVAGYELVVKPSGDLAFDVRCDASEAVTLKPPAGASA
jgi:hypothetical protein